MEGWEIIKSALGSDAGAATFVGGFLLLAVYIYGKVVRIITQHDTLREDYKRHDQKIDKLDLGMQEVRGDIQYIKSTLNSLVNVMQNMVAGNAGTGFSQPLPMLQAHSPLAITEVGRKAVADMGADEALALNWEKIKTILDSEIGSRNPYDIQTYCLEKIPVSPERFIPPAHLNRMKIFAFNQGRTLFDCLKVFGVLVRDRYFAEAEIPLSELDKPRMK